MKCKPADHCGKEYFIHLEIETQEMVYPVKPILSTKPKRPRSKTVEEFLQELQAASGSTLEEPLLDYFRHFFPSGVTEAKEEAFLKLFGPSNKAFQNVGLMKLATHRFSFMLSTS